MADTLQHAINSIADKDVDELFVFFKGQGIYNVEENDVYHRLMNCPLAQYFSKVTGKRVMVTGKQIIMEDELTSEPMNENALGITTSSLGITTCGLPPVLSDFVREADKQMRKGY